MKSKIKVILLGCVPRGRGKKCKVSVVNTESKWHTNKVISKCRETHRNIGGSCKPIIVYDAKTKVPIKL